MVVWILELVISDRRPGACDDDESAQETQAHADQVPPIRPDPFDSPQPNQRSRDVDAAIGCIGPTGGGAVGTAGQSD